MPRNGSGTYSPPVNSWNPATNGVPATASDWQAQLNDIRDALTQSVSRDGQTIISGDLQMGGNKLTNLEQGSLPGDSAAWQQIFSQGQQVNLASAATVDIGAQNSTLINITGTTTITSFGAKYNGPRYIRFDGVLTLTNSATLVLPGAANITTAAGDSAIAVPLGLPATGWRVAAYQRADGQAISAPTSFQASGLTGTVAISNGGTGQATAAGAFNALKQQATDSVTGVVELATNAEAQAATDPARVITPANLAAVCLGVGQTWQSPTRSLGVSYTNTTGRPIVVSIYFFALSASWSCTLTVGSVQVDKFQQANASGQYVTLSGIVPAGATYVATATNASISTWSELI